MKNALIVTPTEKSAASFSEILCAALIKTITPLPTCAEARRMLLARDFDLVLINAPLRKMNQAKALRGMLRGRG